MRFKVWVLGCGVCGLWFGVWDLWFGVQGEGLGDWRLWFVVWGLGFGVWDSGFDSGLGCRSNPLAFTLH